MIFMPKTLPFWRRPLPLAGSEADRKLRVYALCLFAIVGMIWGFRWFSIPAILLGLIIALYLRRSRPKDEI